MNDFMMKEHDELCERLAKSGIRPMVAGWRQSVKVWALPGNPIDWHMESNLKDPQSGFLVFNKGNDNMPKRDYYLIQFDLQDHSGLDLRFEPNPANAFWVAVDQNSPPTCPKSASYSDQIYAICDDPGGKGLTVRNDDKDRAYFTFSLGFISDKDGKPYRYDPGGDNQDGGFAFNYF